MCECKKCGWKWDPRKPGVMPKACPCCKCYNWSVPSVRKIIKKGGRSWKKSDSLK